MSIANHTQAWKFIFDCLGLNVFNIEEIKREDLENPDSVIL
jgi:hypothetical protein